MKKAYELSVLCDAELGLMIFSPRGKLYEFASPSMQKMLERYQKYSQECGINKTIKEQDNQYMKLEITNMEERIRILESSQRKMLGEGLESCSVKEMNQLESQAVQGLRHIRARKTKILVDEIELLERKCLDSRCLDDWVFTTPTIGLESKKHNEIETQLVIRPPNVCDHLF